MLLQSFASQVLNFAHNRTMSVLVDQLVEPPGLPMCSQKECPTMFETR